MNYLKLLEHSFITERELSSPQTMCRTQFLGEYIFNFVTYDDTMSELFVTKAIEVCIAINNEATFKYIEDPENYRWFLLMCNMPFFRSKLEWGTSIRGAWWSYHISLQSCGLWEGEEQLTSPLNFNLSEWKLFIVAIIRFASG